MKLYAITYVSCQSGMPKVTTRYGCSVEEVVRNFKRLGLHRKGKPVTAELTKDRDHA